MHIIESEDPPTPNIFLRYMFQQNTTFPRYCVFVSIDSNTGNHLLDLIKRYISLSGNGDMFTFQSNFVFCKSEDLINTIVPIDSELFSGFDALWFFDVLPESIDYKKTDITRSINPKIGIAIDEFSRSRCVLCLDHGGAFKLISTDSYWINIERIFLDADITVI